MRLTAKGQSQRGRGGQRPGQRLDHAVRNALLPAYPAVERFELIDYKVRILDQGHGTDATVRVLIETTDGLSAWTTVGVGQNIIEASWSLLRRLPLWPHSCRRHRGAAAQRPAADPLGV